MSQPPLQPTPVVLPSSIETLNELRDQLTLALATLEQNTDRVTAWVKANRDAIIIGRHWLVQAITTGDEKQLWAARRGLGTPSQHADDILGFLLSDGTLVAQAIDLCGAKSDVVKYLRAIPAGLPAHLIEEIPEISISDELAEAVARNAAAVESAPVPTPAPVKKAAPLGNIFKSKAAKEMEAAEAQAQVLVGQWKQLHKELLHLQSDRHYFVDSFMDWVGENLAPSAAETNVNAVMTRYRHPVYMLQQAQADYAEALNTRTTVVLDEASLYSDLAGLLDRQDIAGFIGRLPGLFPRPDTQASADLRRLLLKGRNAKTFADMALDASIQSADAKHALLRAAIAFEGHLRVTGYRDANEAYSRILQDVLSGSLPPAALGTALNACTGDRLALATHKGRLLSFFEAFKGEDARLVEGLGAVLRDPDVAKRFNALRHAIDNRDAKAIAACLHYGDDLQMAAKVEALRQLCLPHQSLLQSLRHAAAGNPDVLLPLLIQAMQNELEGELTDSSTLQDVMHKDIFPQLHRVSPAQLATLMSMGRVNDTTAAQRSWIDGLKGANGLIALAARQPLLSAEERLERINILLLPVASLNQKAALLLETADTLSNLKATAAAGLLQDTALLLETADTLSNLKATAAAGLLQDAALSLIGDPLLIGNDVLFAHPGLIANIWYDHDAPGTLKFVIHGKPYEMKKGIDASEAAAVLRVIQTLAPQLMPEQGGLFNPNLCDRIAHDAESSYLYWGKTPAELRIDDTTRRDLQNLPGFIHAQDRDQHISFNPDAILAVLPHNDKWIVIDRLGEYYHVDSLTLPQNDKRLLNAAGSWFNPACTSYLLLDKEARQVRLHCEGPGFAKTLGYLIYTAEISDQIQDHGLILSVEDAAAWQEIETKIQSQPTLLAPGGDIEGVYLNLQTMGFISFQDQIRMRHGARYWHAANNSTLEVPEDVIDNLCHVAEKSSRAMVIDAPGIVAPVIVDRDAIIHAHHNPDAGLLIITMPYDNLSLPLPAADATRILSDLAKDAGRFVIEVDKTPQEVFNYGLTTRMAFEPASAGVKAVVAGRVVTIELAQDKFAAFAAAEAQEARGAVVTGATSAEALKAFRQYCEKPPRLPSYGPVTPSRDPVLVLGEITPAPKAATNETAPVAKKPLNYH